MSTSASTHRMKHALASALLDLMATKPLESITVQELTNRCQIRRQSFYYHFQDLYALLDWILEEKHRSFHENWAQFLNWQSLFLAVLLNFEDNRAHYQCIAKALGTPYLVRIFQTDFQALLSKTLAYYLERTPGMSEKEGKFLLFYYEKIFITLLGSWLCQEIPFTAQELVELVDSALEDQLRGLEQRCQVVLDEPPVEDKSLYFLP